MFEDTDAVLTLAAHDMTMEGCFNEDSDIHVYFEMFSRALLGVGFMEESIVAGAGKLACDFQSRLDHHKKCKDHV